MGLARGYWVGHGFRIYYFSIGDDDKANVGPVHFGRDVQGFREPSGRHWLRAESRLWMPSNLKVPGDVALVRKFGRDLRHCTSR